MLRAILGSRLRKALRAKNLHQRIVALRQDIGAMVARVLRRLPCGLTRRRPIKARCCNWTAGVLAGLVQCVRTDAGAGAGGPVADTS